MDPSKTRLSREAQDMASILSGELDQAVREQASVLAQQAGKECADREDVARAWKLVVRQNSGFRQPDIQKKEPSIAHVCPACVNALFWAHRHALERAMDISNTPGEDEAVKRRGMADAVFDCLSFFDLYYDCCLSYEKGTLKDHEVWVNPEAVSIHGGLADREDLDPPTKEHLHLLDRLFLEFVGAFNAREKREDKRQDCLGAAKGLAANIAKLRYSSDPAFNGLDLL